MHAQDLSGSYTVTGYFFHPFSPRPIALVKTITKVGPNTYQVDILGDLTGWGFQFTVDANNNLTNWVATGNTYPSPASGFMTADNPGGFTFPGPPYPGTSPWLQSTYNNTYDPATNTFYLHYGYNVSATNQNGYDRQSYEQYVLVPRAQISFVTPLSGTSFTQVAINGKNLSLVNPAAFSISFGGVVADTGWVVSDSKIIARVGAGASGNVSITDINYKIDTFPGFVYTPVPPVINTGWSYLGKAGFSSGKAFYISAASGIDNTPYVVFVDSASRRAKVMKFNGSNWSAVGPFVSDGSCSYTDIVLTKNNTPVVAFYDSAAAGITVKAFNSNRWVTLGARGFTSAPSYSQSPFFTGSGYKRYSLCFCFCCNRC
jgi:hypothetical protein